MRSRLVAFLSVVALYAVPVAAHAATTVGATPPPGAMAAADCSANTAHVTNTSSGVTNPYVATVSGVITEWRFAAETSPGTLALQVLTQGSDQFTYTPTAESATEAPAAAKLNRFATRLPIKAGQLIGLHVVTASHGCYRFVMAGTGFTDFAASPAPTVGGGPGSYGGAMADAATNVAATIEPDADGDGFGDETQDGCLGNGQRQDDCIKPSVKIDSGPAAVTKFRSAQFTFSSDDPSAKFECRLDGASFASCTSPLTLQKLKRTAHTFEVRATDPTGNVSTSATYAWKVKKKKKKHRHEHHGHQHQS